MNKQMIIKKCQEIINLHNDHNTFFELLKTVKADGLTIYEAELVSSALYNYVSGATTWFKTSDDSSPMRDTTPHDIVAILRSINNNIDHDAQYRQFTCIDRWGDEQDGNTEYFDPLLDKIINGRAKEVVEELKGWTESDIDVYKYSEVITGKANNHGERVVYDDFTWILTASGTTITLFKKC